MSTFSYFTTLPNANNYPGDDQPGMQTNTASVSGLINVDHVGFNVVGGGEHNQVTFHANQTAPSLGSGVSGLYVNLVSGLSQLFFQNSAGSFQLTKLGVTSSSNAGTAGGTIYTLNTPWGITFYMGQTNSISGSGAKTVVFPTPYSAIYTGQATCNDPNAVAVSVVLGTAQLTIRTGAAAVVNWFAIGAI